MSRLANRSAIGGVLAATLFLAACAADPASVEAAGSPPGKPSTFMSGADIGAVVRAALGGDYEAHYFDAAYDLDGDGREEIVAYVAGPMVCGTGGCNLYVFSPGADGYLLVGRIAVTHPPIRVSPRSTDGWRNLIVRVAGGGRVESFDAELAWDSSTYASNPTIVPAERVTDLDGARTLIPEFESFRDGKPVPPPES